MADSLWVMRWNRIRPYVGFKLKPKQGLSDYEKRKLRRYYKAVQILDSASRPVHVYKGKKGSKRLKGAQRYAQMPSSLSEFQVAFIPNPSGEPVDIHFSRDGKVSEITSKGVRRAAFLFEDYETEPGEFQEDPFSVVERIVHGPAKGLVEFHVLNGAWEIGSSGFQWPFIGEEVARLYNEYKDRKGHEAARWLKGIGGYKFTSKKTAEEYKEARGWNRGGAKAKRARETHEKEFA